MVKKLLSHQTVKVNAKDIKGQTPLHIAYFKKGVSIQQALLSQGAATYILDQQGFLPADLANVQEDKYVMQHQLYTRPYKIGMLKEVNSDFYNRSLSKTRYRTYVTDTGYPPPRV